MGQVFWRSVLLLYVKLLILYYIPQDMYEPLSLHDYHGNHIIGILQIDVTSIHIFIFFHNSLIFPVTSNCSKAVYSPIGKFLNQYWRIKKVVKLNHTVCIFKFLRQIQNNCFRKPKLCLFHFLQDKDQTHTDILFCCSISTTT